ncbi:SpaA isopeptide-forming pilin-related protein, partial [Herbiconiux sp.]|uniref:MSCRAMM family protein n=1 Tax=Herbiconiux sp. TaxID=1871186 RepID=UPI0025BE1E63
MKRLRAVHVSRWAASAVTTALAGALVSALALAGPAGPALADPAPAPDPSPTAGSISGLLLSDQGEPLAGHIYAIEPEEGFEYRGTAGADGAYTIENVPAGDYAVHFEPFWTASDAAPYGYGPAYYPDALRLDDAEPVRVNPSSDTLFVNSALAPAGQISGTVVLATLTGSTPATHTVVVPFTGDEAPPEDPFEAEYGATFVNGDGTFRVHTAPGEHRLAFYTRYHGQWIIDEYWQNASAVADATPLEVVSAEDIPGIAAELLAPGSLQFTLTAPDGTPLPGVDVSLVNHAETRTMLDLVTDANGVALAGDLPPGYYDLSVTNPPAGYSDAFIRGAMVFPGETSTLQSGLGDPLPRGATATPALPTDDGWLLLAGDSVTLTVPDAIDLESVGFVYSSNEQDDPRRGEFTLDGSTWTATIDLEGLWGHGALGIEYRFDLDLTHVAVLDTSIAREPGSAELTDDSRGDVALAGTSAAGGVKAGGTATATGLEPGSWYYAWWFSTPTGAGWVQADATGAVSVPVPAGLVPAGAASAEHSLAFESVQGALAGWTPVTVLAAGNGGGGGGGNGGGGNGGGSGGDGSGG